MFLGHHDDVDMALLYNSHGTNAINIMMNWHSNRPFSAIFWFVGFIMSNGQLWGQWLFFALISVGQFLASLWLLSSMEFKSKNFRTALSFSLATLPLWPGGLFLSYLTPQISIILWLLWLTLTIKLLQNYKNVLNFCLVVTIIIIGILTYPAIIALILGSLPLLIFFIKNKKQSFILAIPFLIFGASRLLFSSDSAYLSDISLSTYVNYLYNINYFVAHFLNQNIWAIVGFIAITVLCVVSIIILSIKYTESKKKILLTIASLIMAWGSIFIFLPLTFSTPDLYLRLPISLLPLLWTTSLMILLLLKSHGIFHKEKIIKIATIALFAISSLLAVTNYIYLQQFSAKLNEAFTEVNYLAEKYDYPTIVITPNNSSKLANHIVLNAGHSTTLVNYYLHFGSVDAMIHIFSSQMMEEILENNDSIIQKHESNFFNFYVFERRPIDSELGRFWSAWYPNSGLVEFFEENFNYFNSEY